MTLCIISVRGVVGEPKIPLEFGYTDLSGPGCRDFIMICEVAIRWDGISEVVHAEIRLRVVRSNTGGFIAERVDNGSEMRWTADKGRCAYRQKAIQSYLESI